MSLRVSSALQAAGTPDPATRRTRPAMVPYGFMKGATPSVKKEVSGNVAPFGGFYKESVGGGHLLTAFGSMTIPKGWDAHKDGGSEGSGAVIPVFSYRCVFDRVFCAPRWGRHIECSCNVCGWTRWSCKPGVISLNAEVNGGQKSGSLPKSRWAPWSEPALPCGTKTKQGMTVFMFLWWSGLPSQTHYHFVCPLFLQAFFSSILTSLIFDSTNGLETKANVLILQRTVLTELTHIILHFPPFTPDSYAFVYLYHTIIIMRIVKGVQFYYCRHGLFSVGQLYFHFFLPQRCLARAWRRSTTPPPWISTPWIWTGPAPPLIRASLGSLTHWCHQILAGFFRHLVPVITHVPHLCGSSFSTSVTSL